MERLYTHQAEAFEAAWAGRDVVVVTPTASGKTLCYNLPVLGAILENPDARALYLFPTKALAQDQLAELYGLNERRLKDPVRALEFAQLALAKLRRTRATPRDTFAAARAARLTQKLLNRVERLEHRIHSRDRAPLLPLPNSGPTLKKPARHLSG
jgi:superfamily II DNA helicase RecQ